jgi:CRISPR system Cascade subunit CasC
MSYLELHKIHTYPGCCLNRDDVGSPKTMIYGGVQRSRISSQCANAAMRKYWTDRDLSAFKGMRTRSIQHKFLTILKDKKEIGNEPLAIAFTEQIMQALGKIDAEKPSKLKAVIFITAEEVTNICTALIDAIIQGNDPILSDFLTNPSDIKHQTKEKVNGKAQRSAIQKTIRKLISGVMKDLPSDGAIVALRGRMFADHHALTSDGAAVSNHPFTTHQTTNETDFFVAVEDNKDTQTEEDNAEERDRSEGPGAAMMDSAQFTSGTFYHYTAINLSDLKSRLANLAREQRIDIIRNFVAAFAYAIPGGKRHSWNADTKPAFILATVATGQPFQLSGAFESPVRSNGHGYEQASIERMLQFQHKYNKAWELSYDLQNCMCPDYELKETYGIGLVTQFKQLLDSLSEHVL